MGDLAGTGEEEEDWQERWESPARGGDGDPQSDSSTQIPESKLLLDWLLLLLGLVTVGILETSGSLLTTAWACLLPSRGWAPSSSSWTVARPAETDNKHN